MNKLLMVKTSLYKTIRSTNWRNYCSSSISIDISDSCANRLKEILSPGENLRITVEGGGCAGFQYKFEIDNKIEAEDRVFQRDNVKVVIDSVSLQYVSGSTVEYDKQLIRSAFVLSNNPHAAGGCSCGSSFSFKLD